MDCKHRARRSMARLYAIDLISCQSAIHISIMSCLQCLLELSSLMSPCCQNSDAQQPTAGRHEDIIPQTFLFTLVPSYDH